MIFKWQFLKTSKVSLELEKENVLKETNISVRKSITCKKICKYLQEKKGAGNILQCPYTFVFIKEILIFVK